MGLFSTFISNETTSFCCVLPPSNIKEAAILKTKDENRRQYGT